VRATLREVADRLRWEGVPSHRRNLQPGQDREPRRSQLRHHGRARVALHELTFALLFIVLIAIPFRRGQRWAWWAAWLPMIANLGYTFTFGAHDHTILARSLIADRALPVLLIAHIPAFFGPNRPQRRAAPSSATPLG